MASGSQAEYLALKQKSCGRPNGAKAQLLMYTNTNYLLDLCILLGLFNRGYQLITQKVYILLIKYWSPLKEQGSF
jgi:hypothetical protein